MPLVHRLASSGLRSIIATICTRGDSLAGLTQLCTALAATIDTEEDSEQDERADTDTDADNQLLVLVDPAQGRGTLALTCAAAATSLAGRTVEVVLVHPDTLRNTY